MDKSPEEQVSEMFANLLPQILAPVIAARQRDIKNLEQEIAQAKSQLEIVRGEVTAACRDLEEISAATSKMSEQYLGMKEKLRVFLLPDEPFSASRIDAKEKFLNEKIAERQAQP
jgi:hypothetical protein